MRTQPYGYTLVEHSARARGQMGFERAVMEKALLTVFELNRAKRVGGVVLETYTEAEELAMALNYPPDTPEGQLIPAFRGTFSTERIDGLAIAIPVREIVP